MTAAAVVHHDFERPVFGYEPPAYGAGSNFGRALEALKDAERIESARARRIAEKVAHDLADHVGDREKQWFLRSRADRMYAQAVYDVEAKRVMSR